MKTHETTGRFEELAKSILSAARELDFFVACHGTTAEAQAYLTKLVVECRVLRQQCHSEVVDVLSKMHDRAVECDDWRNADELSERLVEINDLLDL